MRVENEGYHNIVNRSRFWRLYRGAGEKQVCEKKGSIKRMDKSFKVTECVTWVGKIDHELQTFHGDELSTQRGSSYNAYLVRGRCV